MKKVTKSIKNISSLQSFPLFTKLISLLILGVFVLLQLREFETGVRYSTFILTITDFAIFVLMLLKQKTFLLPKIVTIFLGSFVLWIIFISFFSHDIGNSLWEIVKMTSFFFMFFCFYNLLRENKQTQQFFIYAFAAIGAVLLMKDLYIFVTDGEMASGGFFVGTFYWHNQMAGFLLFLIPIFLSLVLFVKNILLKLLFSFLVTAGFFGMIFTHSRGGMLSLLLGLLLFAVLQFRTFKTNWPYLLIIVIICLSFFPLLKRPLSKNAQPQSITREISPVTRTVSGDLRISVWQNSIRMLETFPITGVGPGGFASAYHNFQNTPWLFSSNAHNYFLEIAAETGIVGLLLFVGIFAAVAKLVWQNKKLLFNKSSNLASVILVILTASLIHTLVDVDWSRVTLFLLFWIFFAFFLALMQQKDLSVSFRGRTRLIFIVPFVFLLFAMWLFMAEKNSQTATKYLNKKDTKNGIAYIQKAVKINPFESSYHFLLAELYEDTSKVSDAKREYEAILPISPFYSEPYFQLGQIAYQNKKINEAQKYTEKAISLTPYSDIKYYNFLSDIYQEQGHYDKAEKLLKTAIDKIFPLNESYKGFEYLYIYTGFNHDLAFAYFRLINIDVKNHNKAEAKKYLSVVEKDLDPKNPYIPIFKKIL